MIDITALLGARDRLADKSPWFLVAIGAIFLVAGVLSVASGRISQQGGRKWGFPINYQVEREQSPIQFWFLVLLHLLIGGGLLLYGVNLLVQ